MSLFPYVIKEDDNILLRQHCKVIQYALIHPREYGCIQYKTVEKPFMFFFKAYDLEAIPPLNNLPVPHGLRKFGYTHEDGDTFANEHLITIDAVEELKEIAFRGKVGITVYCSYELYQLINKILEE